MASLFQGLSLKTRALLGIVLLSIFWFLLNTLFVYSDVASSVIPPRVNSAPILPIFNLTSAPLPTLRETKWPSAVFHIDPEMDFSEPRVVVANQAQLEALWDLRSLPFTPPPRCITEPSCRSAADPPPGASARPSDLYWTKAGIGHLSPGTEGSHWVFRPPGDYAWTHKPVHSLPCKLDGGGHPLTPTRRYLDKCELSETLWAAVPELFAAAAFNCTQLEVSASADARAFWYFSSRFQDDSRPRTSHKNLLPYSISIWRPREAAPFNFGAGNYGTNVYFGARNPPDQFYPPLYRAHFSNRGFRFAKPHVVIFNKRNNEFENRGVRNTLSYDILHSVVDMLVARGFVVVLFHPWFVSDREIINATAAMHESALLRDSFGRDNVYDMNVLMSVYSSRLDRNAVLAMVTSNAAGSIAPQGGPAHVASKFGGFFIGYFRYWSPNMITVARTVWSIYSGQDVRVATSAVGLIRVVDQLTSHFPARYWATRPCPPYSTSAADNGSAAYPPCYGHGRCEEGVCICQPGYGYSDCRPIVSHGAVCGRDGLYVPSFQRCLCYHNSVGARCERKAYSRSYSGLIDRCLGPLHGQWCTTPCGPIFAVRSYRVIFTTYAKGVPHREYALYVPSNSPAAVPTANASVLLQAAVPDKDRTPTTSDIAGAIREAFGPWELRAAMPAPRYCARPQPCPVPPRRWERIGSASSMAKLWKALDDILPWPDEVAAALGVPPSTFTSVPWALQGNEILMPRMHFDCDCVKPLTVVRGYCQHPDDVSPWHRGFNLDTLVAAHPLVYSS